MTTARDITIYQGQAFALSLDYAGTAGRGQRMHIRLADSTATVVQILTHNGDANARVLFDGAAALDITIGASVSAGWVVLADRVEWVYDIEDYDLADEDNCVIPYRGKVIVRGNRTRASDVTPSDQMPSGDGRYVRFDGVQGLSAGQQLQARENIGAGTGGGSSAWGGITGTLTDQTDLNAALGLKAPLASPTFTGTPAAPTAAGATSTTQIATTAFVGGEITTHAGATDPHGDRSFATSAVSTHSALTTGAHGLGGASQLNVGTTAGTVAAGDHAHSGVYQPLATVLTNTTAAFTTAQETKLAGIETAADVTDAGNVGAAIDGATAKTTPVDADTVPLIDSAAGNVLKKLSWANIKATAKTYFDTLYQAASATLTTWAGITPGTGVATALGTNVGSAGAVVTNGGALGTPSSGNLGSCTFPTLNQNTSGYAEALKSATTTVTVSAATAPSSGQVLTATSSTAATWQTPASANTKWVGAGELIPRVTSGAGIDGEELATNKINLDYLAFDTATSEYAQVAFAWPGSYTTFTATFHWTAASGSGTVIWGAAARCYADDDALDQAQGTAQTVTDTLLAANDAHKSSATSAVTPGGTVAAGNLCVVQVHRDISDTLAVDARLIGVLLEFAA